MNATGILSRAGRCLAAGVALASATCAMAQEQTWEKSSLEFPNVWVGSDPIKLADLKGKAALLYFYEEDCPKCKGRWPEVLVLAQKYADKPIAFVAVNSGNPAPMVAQYARSVGLSWPVIVDVDRSFEQACEVNEIGLANVTQVRYITPKGEVQHGNWANLDQTIEQALKGASWNIEPSEIPAELWPAWRSIEFSQYAPVAGALAKARTSRSADVKAAAQKLWGLVNKKGAEALAAAKTEAEKSKLRAYEQYGVVAERFAGYPAGSEAAAARREIAKDADYRKEQTAVKQILRQRPLAGSTKPAIRARAIAAIKQIVAEQPGSEAARLGQEILDRQ